MPTRHLLYQKDYPINDYIRVMIPTVGEVLENEDNYYSMVSMLTAMSVLKAHRSESKAEFVNVANKIYIQTIAFLSRLSSRYSRLVSKSVSELASEVVDHAEKANSIYPSDAARKELRKQHLLEARASLMALDVHLAHCYDLMMTNPSGCFTTGSGNSVGASDAKKKLEHMAQELGDLIDAENGLLTNVLKSDKSR